MLEDLGRRIAFKISDTREYDGREFQVGILSTVDGAQADARHFLPPDEYWEIEVDSDWLNGLTVGDFFEFLDFEPANHGSKSVSARVVIYSHADRVGNVTVGIKFAEGRVEVDFLADRESDRPIPMEIAVEISERALADGNLIFGECGIDWSSELWEVTSKIASLDMRLCDIWTTANTLAARLQLPGSEGSSGRWFTAQALRGGRYETIIGQRESRWLDAKRDMYRLDSKEGKFELAKDAAQFANSADGGILAIGYSTRRLPGGIDVIDKFVGVSASDRDVQSIRGVLGAKVYPPIENLTVDIVECPVGTYLIVEVPIQSAALKPFIVESGVVGSKHLESVFMIPRRVHDGIRPTTASEIHSLLAGRLFSPGGSGFSE